MLDKSKMKCNQPHRTPNDPKKSHVVKACYGGKEKIIHFGQQGAITAGKPKEGESERMKMKRKSFKARHAQNIAKGPSSAAYWANKVKWATGGKVDVKNKPAEMSASPQNPVLGALAKGVKGLRDLAGRYQLHPSIPLVGGVGIDEMLGLPGATKELENWSYGNWPFRINPYAGQTASRLFEMKPGRQSNVADLALLGGDVVPVAKLAKKAIVSQSAKSIDKMVRNAYEKGLIPAPGLTIKPVSDKSLETLAAHYAAAGYPESTAHKIASGELPMDWKSRMARAKKQGYTLPGYIGTEGNVDILQFNPDIGTGARKNTGTWGVLNQPEIANTYATTIHGGAVYPVLIRDKGLATIDVERANWKKIGPEAYIRHADDTGTPVEDLLNDPGYDFASTNDIARFSRREGDKGLIFQDISDPGPYSRAYSYFNVPETSNNFVIFDPSLIRSSTSAAFDPEQIHSKNILAGAGAAGAGLTYDPNEINAIAEEFNRQYQ